MNTIIRKHYPASKLPTDLREGIDPAIDVTVTIVEEERAPERIPTLDEIFARRQPPYRTAEDIDAEMRQARDDWDS